jgi:hypothetical protein
MIVLGVAPPVLAGLLVAPKVALLACLLPIAIAAYVLWNVALMHCLAWVLNCTVRLVDTLQGGD